MRSRVVVGMSGGVDSSVAAYLLQRQGLDVVGVTMKIWGGETRETLEDHGGCCGLSATEDARRVSDTLGIPFYVLNFSDVFQRTVIDPFAEAYWRGRTPNPCIACNQYVKWEALLSRALALGADFIATGHYARVTRYPATGRRTLARAIDARKDQTYALYTLTQDQLARTLMPVGEYNKLTVRGIAEKMGLCVAHKPDSQEICFIPDNNYGGFLRELFGADFGAGAFVDTDGNVIGAHTGYYKYTVGQRRGVGAGFGKRVYVQKVDCENCSVTLADDAALYTDTVIAEDARMMGLARLDAPVRARAKIRYNHAAADCTVYPRENGFRCVFDTPQRAPAPGQAVVCYDNEYLLFGGTIAV